MIRGFRGIFLTENMSTLIINSVLVLSKQQDQITFNELTEFLGLNTKNREHVKFMEECIKELHRQPKLNMHFAYKDTMGESIITFNKR